MTKHAEELAKLGWQYFECPACGSEGARAFPKPQQEPVAYDKTELNCFAQDLYDQKMREGRRGHYESMFHVIHQCIKKVAPQPEQEPVAFICEFYADKGYPFVSFEPVTHGTNTPLYTTPPQRKPLTDEEIEDLYFDKFSMSELKAFARAIEAAHGIKGD